MDIVSRNSHPILDGVEYINYRLPKKDPTGTAIPGQFQTTVHQKTVFDPSLISLNEFIRRGLEAANNIISISDDGKKWTGVDRDGIQWQGYINLQNGQIITFWPVVPSAGQ